MSESACVAGFRDITPAYNILAVDQWSHFVLQGAVMSPPAYKDSSGLAGEWVEVLDKQQGRHLGASGMAFQ